MNEREINKSFLYNRIDEFKKKYTELLMQLDNSSILNLDKFNNIEDFQNNDNVFALLKENEQVAKNLVVIRESIKNKLINLQFLAAKSKNENADAYANLYDFDVLNDVRHYYESSFSKNQMQQILNDIDTAMSKIEQMSTFIEQKVIPKLNQEEEQNKELAVLLNESQKRIEELLTEKQIDQKTIADLSHANNELETEYHKFVDMWIELNQKIISLEGLIDENDIHNREISEEKDKIIDSLEKKINELMLDLDPTHISTFNQDNSPVKICEAFVGFISRIFNESLKCVYTFENNYSCKIKDFNKYRDLLTKDLTNSKVRNDASQTLITNLSKNDFVDVEKDDIFEFLNLLRDIKNLVAFKEYLNLNFVNCFENIEQVFVYLLDEFKLVLMDEADVLSKRSVKRLNSFIVQIESYLEKVSVLKSQFIFFIDSLNSFVNNTNFDMVDIKPYWAEAAYGFNEILIKVNKDFFTIIKLMQMFFAYLRYWNSGDLNQVDYEFSQIFNQLQDLSLNQDLNKLQYAPIQKKQTQIKDYEVKQIPVETEIEVEAEEVEANVEVLNLVEDNSATISENDSEESLSNDINSFFNELQKNYDVENNVAKSKEDFEKFINNFEQKVNFDQNIIKADANEVDDFEKDLDKQLNDLADSDLLKSYIGGEKLQQQISDFTTFATKIFKDLEKTDLDLEVKEFAKKQLYEIFVNEKISVKNKLIAIEKILKEIFKDQYYKKSFCYWIITFKKYLLDKKYNINLKLKIVKSKLTKLKILIDLENEANFLSLFENEA
ncbi:MAG: hypothetical protein HUJ42_01280 [Malacoplasma sp.]|mgnify:CR=1 FL=1|nr:hypothetical protein [Malacoplasma sp.]